MRNVLLSVPLLLGVPALPAEPLVNDVYQIRLKAREAGMYMSVCIHDQCQKSLAYAPAADGYLYDFGTFAISDTGNIELLAFRYFPEQRRVRRPPEYQVRNDCSIDHCGGYIFIKSDGPLTSTTDKCEVGLAYYCNRHHPGKYGNARQWGY